MAGDVLLVPKSYPMLLGTAEATCFDRFSAVPESDAQLQYCQFEEGECHPPYFAIGIPFLCSIFPKLDRFLTCGLPEHTIQLHNLASKHSSFHIVLDIFSWKNVDSGWRNHVVQWKNRMSDVNDTQICWINGIYASGRNTCINICTATCNILEIHAIAAVSMKCKVYK